MNLDTLMTMNYNNKAFIYQQRSRLLVIIITVKMEPLASVMVNPQSGDANILVFAQNGTRERTVNVSTIQKCIIEDICEQQSFSQDSMPETAFTELLVIAVATDQK